ncbi:glycosyltransferase family 39 protein [Hymenobacter sp. BT507]|uniref:Glycosyltransferase family 39 protein n=1 Tax=Hymenobacter citatus TaxID=2763506 RepID=A0ABR7ME70_9BACT|nr:glycosyltransferase family 39 protein [Hymenobacter citatus]MBC6609356.1 glycosyltransferase family 39 protein [Hymenobacter citatus]
MDSGPSMTFSLKASLQSSVIQRRLYALAFMLICGLGIALRLIQYPNIPPGFNQDEASSLYEAYCLAETGMDRWGNVLPPYFPSWGSGQNVLLSYLSAPVVKGLGLSVFSARLVPVMLGILTLPLLGWGLRPLGRYPALLGMFLVAIVPWHFMLSRWALESNLAPFFMLLGCVLLIRGILTGRRRWIVPSLVPFALALYAYGTTVIVLPTMLVLLLCFYWRVFWQQKTAWLLAFVLFATVAFPFGVYLTENHVLHRNLAWTDSLFFATPLLPSNRLAQLTEDDAQEQNRREQQQALLNTNRAFINTGFQDGSVYNVLPGFPPLLLFSLPLGLAGMVAAVFVLVRQLRYRTFSAADVVVTVFFCWGLSALPMRWLFILNVNRFNHFYLPLLVLAVWLVHLIITNTTSQVSKPLLRVLVVGWLAVEGGLAIDNYFTLYRSSSVGPFFNKGLDQAFAAAKQLPINQIRITESMPLPYVYTLFFTQYSPQDFQQYADYQINNGVYQVFRFGKYVFTDDRLTPHQPHGYLMRRGEVPADVPGRQVVFSNDDWEVGILQ